MPETTLPLDETAVPDAPSEQLDTNLVAPATDASSVSVVDANLNPSDPDATLDPASAPSSDSAPLALDEGTTEMVRLILVIGLCG